MAAARSSSSSTSFLRFSNEPLVHSVLAYGSETLVPDHDICRLAYYLKCCVVGCGIDLFNIDDRLVDYQAAHRLPAHLQERIIQLSFNELRLESLINRAFILDDAHLLLPRGTLNTFYEFKTASSLFSVLNRTVTIIAGQQVRVHKVMLCTFKWMKEYYIDPFLEYQQGNSLVEVRAIRMPSTSLLTAPSASTMMPPLQEEQEDAAHVQEDPAPHHQDDTQTDEDENEEESGSGSEDDESSTNYDEFSSASTRALGRRQRHEEPTTIIPMMEPLCTTHHNIQCNFCQVNDIEGPRYRCRQCLLFNLCEECYSILGAHDNTHEFERIRYVDAIAEPLTAQVESLPSEAHSCSFIPDIPMAIAVPVLQNQESGRPQKKAKIALPDVSALGLASKKSLVASQYIGY